MAGMGITEGNFPGYNYYHGFDLDWQEKQEVNQRFTPDSETYRQWLRHRDRFQQETASYSVPQQNVMIIRNLYDRREKRARVDRTAE